MKEIMLYYAHCNKLVNENLAQVLQEHIEHPCDLPLEGYYFKTLGAIFDHQYATDMFWMQAFLDIESYGLDLEKEFGFVPKYGDRVFQSFDTYVSQRTKLDTFILRFVSCIDEKFLLQTVSRKLKDGTVLKRIAYKAMVHFFNHQTHHRGQISAILDERNIVNNFSNMIFEDI